MVLPDLFTPLHGSTAAAALLAAAVALACAAAFISLPRLFGWLASMTPEPANDNDDGFRSPRSRIFEV
ncbi:MAG: hypothetical protein NW203_08200 [Hyphomonadaceae bacterium]|nr:hypothetical protein [Hyphomonadaceae bacterium]